MARRVIFLGLSFLCVLAGCGRQQAPRVLTEEERQAAENRFVALIQKRPNVPEDAEAIHEAMSASYEALRTGTPVMSRYTLGMGYSGGHARRLVECLAKFNPNPKVPFSASELDEVHGTFRVVQ